jgi:phage terminase large subunit
VNYGIQILQQKKMFITSSSQNIISEFQKYMWKKDRNGGYDTTPIDAHNHACDALRYVAMSKLGVRKEGGNRPFVGFMNV